MTTDDFRVMSDYAARAQYRAEQIAARCTRTLGSLQCKGFGDDHTHRYDAGDVADRHDESEGSES